MVSTSSLPAPVKTVSLIPSRMTLLSGSLAIAVSLPAVPETNWDASIIAAAVPKGAKISIYDRAKYI